VAPDEIQHRVIYLRPLGLHIPLAGALRRGTELSPSADRKKQLFQKRAVRRVYSWREKTEKWQAMTSRVER
jgi:hypothetical protein